MDIQAHLNGAFSNPDGKISKGKDYCVFRVITLKQVVELIQFFDQYPLITQKKADYILFKEIAMIMQRREHLTTSGLQEIINLRSSLNLGLSELKAAFPKTILANKPKVENQRIPHPQWVAGFSTGEGCFSVAFSNDRFKYLSFKLTQDTREEQLIGSFLEFWGVDIIILVKEGEILKLQGFRI